MRGNAKTRFMQEVRTRYIRACHRVQLLIESSTQVSVMFTCYTMWKNTMVCLGLIDVLCIAYLPHSRQNCGQYQRHRTRTCVLPVSHLHSHCSLSKDAHPHSQLTDSLSVFFGRHIESGNVLITDFAQASTNGWSIYVTTWPCSLSIVCHWV